MKFAGLTAAALALGLVSSVAHAADQPAVYANQCASCHGASLQGGKGPALQGARFMGTWRNKTARNLYSRILSTMPVTAPGTLSPKDTVEITKYLLRENKVDVGTNAPKSPDDLNAIRILSPTLAAPAR